MATPTVQPLYASSAAITITLNSLGSGSSRQATAINNTSGLLIDAQVAIEVTVGTVSGTPTLSVFAAGSLDNTLWPDGITGTDGAFTPVSPTNLALLGVLNTPTNATAYVLNVKSVALAFGGCLPPYWTLVVTNNSGAALAGSGNACNYVGLNYKIPSI